MVIFNNPGTVLTFTIQQLLQLGPFITLSIRCANRSTYMKPSLTERGDVPISDSDLELRERLQQILLDLQPYM